MKKRFLFNIDTDVKEMLLLEATIRKTSMGRVINDVMKNYLLQKKKAREEVEKGNLSDENVLIDPFFIDGWK